MLPSDARNSQATSEEAMDQTITIRKMLYTLLKRLSTFDARTKVKSPQPKTVTPTAPAGSH
jgi:hypothetical protein